VHLVACLIPSANKYRVKYKEALLVEFRHKLEQPYSSTPRETPPSLHNAVILAGGLD